MLVKICSWLPRHFNGYSLNFSWICCCYCCLFVGCCSCCFEQDMWHFVSAYPLFCFARVFIFVLLIFCWDYLGGVRGRTIVQSKVNSFSFVSPIRWPRCTKDITLRHGTTSRSTDKGGLCLGLSCDQRWTGGRCFQRQIAIGTPLHGQLTLENTVNIFSAFTSQTRLGGDESGSYKFSRSAFLSFLKLYVSPSPPHPQCP